MKKAASCSVIFSPSDLIRYVASPYSSWMDRLHLEHRDGAVPDADSEEQELVARIGHEHEAAVLAGFRTSDAGLISIETRDADAALAETLAAVRARSPVIYQGAFADDRFMGFSDFALLDPSGRYEIWDTKLARTPKPYYAVQLCCYSEMFAATTSEPMPDRFGIILGSGERAAFRVEDFIHYYRRIRHSFLALQDGFTDQPDNCPEPLAGADHGRWTSHAKRYFEERDHLVRVAGISVGQIRKLKPAGVTTMRGLAAAAAAPVPRLAGDTLGRLIAQARLQVATMADRAANPEAQAHFEVITNGAGGLAALPPAHPADVFFDMEGYPLVAGGLEYLFGACTASNGTLGFHDWWAHSREEEKATFEAFVDWVFARWRTNPGMHIFHYAAYEVSALRRLSIRHDTRQDEVDDLLRHEVFVDLLQIVRHGIRIGESDYSIKTVERFYRPRRSTAVATAAQSIVQYAGWMASNQPPAWRESPLLKAIRDYNEDDCRSTAELVVWLRGLAARHGIHCQGGIRRFEDDSDGAAREPSPEALRRQELAAALRARPDELSHRLAELVDFHRREQKPMWWRMFDRADATADELRDDPGCIEGVVAVGDPAKDKRSLIQTYRFGVAQECKLTGGDRASVRFQHNLASISMPALDLEQGTLQLKIGQKGLNEKFDGIFPRTGSLLQNERVPIKVLQESLADQAEEHLRGAFCATSTALLSRVVPSVDLQGLRSGETTLQTAIRVCLGMNGECLVVQGPPGTGKTYTGARVIAALIAAGKTVAITSNSHKAIDNLFIECGKALRSAGEELHGVRAGGSGEGALFDDNRNIRHVAANKDARSAFTRGVVGGTAWLFALPEWSDALDYLVIDEASQVSLANAVAMARCARNVILLGDQMQLEQPVQGVHPGDSGLAGLQYALKDLIASKPDEPVFHAVVPPDHGLFLGESYRMHPDVCRFISDSIYEGRLTSHPDCERQRIDLAGAGRLIGKQSGIAFSGVEHDGNIQQSDEERVRVVAIYRELAGRPYTASDGTTRPLALDDFLFVAPYNAQVRSLQAALPPGARVGSVDRFQGQQAPVCILSLCSSYGEYGARGLGFILDRNRLNVAISRAQCLAVVVADPRIASTSANSLSETSLINLFCKVASTGGS